MEGSSPAGVNLKISEITLLCAGSMGLLETNINMSPGINGNFRAGGFTLGQYMGLHS